MKVKKLKENINYGLDRIKDPILFNINGLSNPTIEVLRYLDHKGYDANAKDVRNYADAVAEYIDIVRSTGEDYSVADWYRETIENYPEELSDLSIRDYDYGDIASESLSEAYNVLDSEADWALDNKLVRTDLYTKVYGGKLSRVFKSEIDGRLYALELDPSSEGYRYVGTFPEYCKKITPEITQRLVAQGMLESADRRGGWEDTEWRKYCGVDNDSFYNYTDNEDLDESLNEDYAEDRLKRLISAQHFISPKDRIQLFTTPKGNYEVRRNGKKMMIIGKENFRESEIEDLRLDGYFDDYMRMNESLRGLFESKDSYFTKSKDELSYEALSALRNFKKTAEHGDSIKLDINGEKVIVQKEYGGWYLTCSKARVKGPYKNIEATVKDLANGIFDRVEESLTEATQKNWVVFFDENGKKRAGSEGAVAFNLIPSNIERRIKSSDFHLPKWVKSYIILSDYKFNKLDWDELEEYNKNYGKPINESFNEDSNNKRYTVEYENTAGVGTYGLGQIRVLGRFTDLEEAIKFAKNSAVSHGGYTINVVDEEQQSYDPVYKVVARWRGDSCKLEQSPGGIEYVDVDTSGYRWKIKESLTEVEKSSKKDYDISEKRRDFIRAIEICQAYDPYTEYIENGRQQASKERLNDNLKQEFKEIMSKYGIYAYSVPKECTYAYCRTDRDFIEALKKYVNENRMTNKEIVEALNRLDNWAINNDSTFYDLKTFYEAYINPNSPVDQKKKQKIEKALSDPSLNKDKEKLQDYIAGVLARKQEALGETFDDEFDAEDIDEEDLNEYMKATKGDESDKAETDALEGNYTSPVEYKGYTVSSSDKGKTFKVLKNKHIVKGNFNNFVKAKDYINTITEDLEDDLGFLENYLEDEVPDVVTETEIVETEMPMQGQDIGLSDMILDSIESSTEKIREYNSLSANLGEHEDELKDVLEDISMNENETLGKLQSMLKVISPNAENIMNGAVEAEELIEVEE